MEEWNAGLRLAYGSERILGQSPYVQNSTGKIQARNYPLLDRTMDRLFSNAL